MRHIYFVFRAILHVSFGIRELNSQSPVEYAVVLRVPFLWRLIVDTTVLCGLRILAY